MADSPDDEMTKTAAPLLDLDTLVVRPSIIIDGARYDVLSPSEISVIESHRFGVWGRRIDQLQADDSEAAQPELAALVSTVALKVARVGEPDGVPSLVFEKLSGSHKWSIVDVFTGLLLHQKFAVAGAIATAAGQPWNPWEAGQSTGETSSPGSSAFMAAAPRGGWLKRLWPW